VKSLDKRLGLSKPLFPIAYSALIGQTAQSVLIGLLCPEWSEGPICGLIGLLLTARLGNKSPILYLNFSSRSSSALDTQWHEW